MEALGVDEVYIDRMSGKNTNRPELQKMMEYVRRGDTVIVESISRFARNTRDLLELVEQLTAKGVEFVSKSQVEKRRHYRGRGHADTAHEQVHILSTSETGNIGVKDSPMFQS